MVNFQRKTPDQQRFSRNLGTGAEGSVQVTVGVMLAAIGEEVICVKLQASGGIKAGIDAFLDDEGAAGEVSMGFSGLVGVGQVTFLWGWVGAKETITFIEQKQWFGPETVRLWPLGAHANAAHVSPAH